MRHSAKDRFQSTENHCKVACTHVDLNKKFLKGLSLKQEIFVEQIQCQVSETLGKEKKKIN